MKSPDAVENARAASVTSSASDCDTYTVFVVTVTCDCNSVTAVLVVVVVAVVALVGSSLSSAYCCCFAMISSHSTCCGLLLLLPPRPPPTSCLLPPTSYLLPPTSYLLLLLHQSSVNAEDEGNACACKNRIQQHFVWKDCFCWMPMSIVDPFGCNGVSVRALFLRGVAAIFSVAFASLCDTLSFHLYVASPTLCACMISSPVLSAPMVCSP
jgi:hypothetical protein